MGRLISGLDPGRTVDPAGALAMSQVIELKIIVSGMAGLLEAIGYDSALMLRQLIEKQRPRQGDVRAHRLRRVCGDVLQVGAHGAHVASRLAHHGAVGPQSVLEGKFGLYHAFLAAEEGTVDIEGQLADLGSRWETWRTWWFFRAQTTGTCPTTSERTTRARC